jgi:two-component system, NarL family, nitrate/nitrite response regulator NarL
MCRVNSREQRQVRLVIADDHPIFRDGLRRSLEAEAGLKVVGQASDGAEAVKLVQQLKPDILLLDLAMPNHPGLEALRELSGPANAPPVKVILLTATVEKSLIVQALQLGARGVVLKDSAAQVLPKAVQAVMAGGYWADGKSVPNLAQYLRRLAQSRPDEARQKKSRLTPRELEIVAGLVTGRSNKEIAECLKNIRDKLDASTRPELAPFGLNQAPPKRRFWRSAWRRIEAIDPLEGISTVLAISILVLVLFLLAVAKHGG